MSLEKNRENKEKYEENSQGNSHEDIHVKSSIDHSSCESSQLCDDGENDVQDLDELNENDLNELAFLSFFNDFDLIDIGIHDFIREVYFED